jgi:Flp pilus assembly pilin Flp
MMQLYLYIRSWLANLAPEDGQDLIEYALLIGLISLIAIVAIALAGDAISNVWSVIASTLVSVAT